MKTNVILFFLILFFLLGCKEKHTPTYYMYDYCFGDGIILRKKALIIKQEIINDSISLIEVTNHRQEQSPLICYMTYNGTFYQKNTSKGIYYSEDGVNYYLFYDFESGKKYNPPFYVFKFFGDELPESIRNDTDTLTESPRWSRIKFFQEYPPHYETIFTEGFYLPLFSRDHGRCRYYQLSAVINGNKSNEILNLVSEIRNDNYFFGRDYNDAKGIAPSPRPCYEEVLNKIDSLKEQGYSLEEISKMTDVPVKELKKIGM